MRFCLKFPTVLLKALEKLFWEVRDVQIKIFNFFEKWYKNREFQVWLQLKGTKKCSKVSDLRKIKIFSNLLQKNGTLRTVYIVKGNKRAFLESFTSLGNRIFQKRWHHWQLKLPFLWGMKKYFSNTCRKLALCSVFHRQRGKWKSVSQSPASNRSMSFAEQWKIFLKSFAKNWLQASSFVGREELKIFS